MNIQFKKGVLELCVLSMLFYDDKYGYELANSLSKEIDISDGTIYPLLRRLKKEGYVTTYLRESTEGPSRKYYRLTDSGKDTKVQLENEWANFTESVNRVVKGGNSHE